MPMAGELGLPPSALARTAPSGSHHGVGDGSAQVPTARPLPPGHDEGRSFPVKALLGEPHEFTLSRFVRTPSSPPWRDSMGRACALRD